MRRIMSLIILTGLIVSGNESSARELDPGATGYYLKPQSAEVNIGKTISLNLVFCHAWIDKADKADAKFNWKVDPHPTLECGGSVIPFTPDTVTWEIEGKGSLRGDKEGATYQAPASMPTPNKVLAKATLTYNSMKIKRILISEITIVDADYSGSFNLHDVSVNSEYATDLSGDIRWFFDENHEIGDPLEYNGRGTASLSIKRIGCEGASFSSVPVTGRLKVHDDNTYEFQIDLEPAGDDELTRNCHRPDLDGDPSWEETFSAAGSGMSSADLCGGKEFYPHYTTDTDLTLSRNRSCANNVINQYQDGWSFKAVK
jgi:hypothetical protein